MNKLKFNHNSKTSSKSNRQLKVAESVKRSLSDVLNNDKVMTFALGDQSFTISKVDMSPDLKNAKIYILPFGADNVDDCLNILNENRSLIKKYLVGKIVLKFTPELKFIYDDSFDIAAKISDILDDSDL
jgi:ribosome-binding factor A